MLRHLIATTVVAASVGTVPTSALAQTGRTEPELRRNATAVHALGIPAVQAWASDGPHATAVRVGVADIHTGRPVPPNGAFRIASTAKTLTATVILQLVGEGRLSIDDPVERWLPGVVHGRAITVRQLLQHTSGLQDALPGWETEAEYRQMRYQRDSMAELVERSVARGVRSSPEIERPHARAYELFDGELVDVTSRFTAYPAGGVVSTTGDLDRFFRALLGGRLLRPTELAEMMDAVPVSSDVEPIWPGGLYGLGLVSRELPCGGRYWGHDGGDAGTITTVGVTADGRRGAVVNTNLALDDTFDHLLTQLHTTDSVVTDALC